MDYFVYLLASQKNGTLYAGVTNNLVRRIHEHRSNAVAGFTSEKENPGWADLFEGLL